MKNVLARNIFIQAFKKKFVFIVMLYIFSFLSSVSYVCFFEFVPDDS